MKPRTLLLAASVAAVTACDDQIKYVPIFSTMADQSSVEAFEAAPRTAVPGTVPIDHRGKASFEEAMALTNPLRSTPDNIARGGELFRQFCTPCHGTEGRGDGIVVGPNRLPAMPTMDLTAARAQSLSDGFIFWKIAPDTPGVMPSYKRIPQSQRWYIVTYIRELQRAAGGQP